jgi:sRNA-binding carbon storage regulator CsrA
MIKCVITSIGSIVVGQVTLETDEEIILGDPREVQIMQTGPNQTKFSILNIFGKPKTVEIQKKNIMLQYDLEDPNIISVYEEQISNIRRPKPGELETLINKNRH